MAFAQVEQRARAVSHARGVLDRLRGIHQMAIDLRDARALYIAGTDPVFNAAFDALYNAAGDRTELAGMINDLTALVITDWEAVHSAVLGLP